MKREREFEANEVNRQIAKQKQLDQVKQARFGSIEFWIVVIVVLVIAAVGLPIFARFVSGAGSAAKRSNAQAIRITLSSMLLLGSYQEADIAAFKEKYAIYQPIEEISGGTNPLEQDLLRNLMPSKELDKEAQKYLGDDGEGNSDAEQIQAQDITIGSASGHVSVSQLNVKGFLKIELLSVEDLRVYIADNENGKGEVVYP